MGPTKQTGWWIGLLIVYGTGYLLLRELGLGVFLSGLLGFLGAVVGWTVLWAAAMTLIRYYLGGEKDIPLEEVARRNAAILAESKEVECVMCSTASSFPARFCCGCGSDLRIAGKSGGAKNIEERKAEAPPQDLNRHDPNHPEDDLARSEEVAPEKNGAPRHLVLEVVAKTESLVSSVYNPTITEGMAAAGIPDPDGIRSSLCARVLSFFLGLVAMRESRGDPQYLSSAEFQSLQAGLLNKYAQYTFLPQDIDYLKRKGKTWEDIAALVRDGQVDDFAAIHSAVTEYCALRSQGRLAPVKPLLDWFKSDGPTWHLFGDAFEAALPKALSETLPREPESGSPSADPIQSCLEELERLMEESSNLVGTDLTPPIRKHILNREATLGTLELPHSSPRTVVLLILCNVIAEILPLGRHHVYRGTLGMEGQQMLDMWDLAIDEMETVGFYTAAKAQEEREWMKKQIARVG